MGSLVIDRDVALTFIRGDYESELTALALGDPITTSRTPTYIIEPGSPWENPSNQSFNNRPCKKCLTVEQFNTLLEAQIVIEDFRRDYNNYRPHSALGMLDPTERATPQPPSTLS